MILPLTKTLLLAFKNNFKWIYVPLKHVLSWVHLKGIFFKISINLKGRIIALCTSRTSGVSVTSNLSLEGNIIIRQQKDATPQHFEKGQEEEEDKILPTFLSLLSSLLHNAFPACRNRTASNQKQDRICREVFVEDTHRLSRKMAALTKGSCTLPV